MTVLLGLDTEAKPTGLSLNDIEPAKTFETSNKEIKIPENFIYYLCNSFFGYILF